MKAIKLFLLIIFSWTSIAEAKMITKEQIIGSWRIVDFTIISKNGAEEQWAKKTHGTLIYTPENFMSVSINGRRNNDTVYLFYSGKYIVCKNNVIKHRVLNATDPNRINKTMIRTASYNKNVLTLTASGAYGTAVIRWKKYNLS